MSEDSRFTNFKNVAATRALESERRAILADIKTSLGNDFAAPCSLSLTSLAEEYLSEQRMTQQIQLLESAVGALANRRVLEIGSGYGMFVVVSTRAFGADCFGVEPGSAPARIARGVLRLYGLDPSRIVLGAGEQIPIRSESFDVVYSCNVLEHVNEPRTVLREAVRVLKPGGFLFFVVPNYGSFWEGHYGLPWVPYMPHVAARWFVRLLGKDPSYLDSLQFINYFSLRRCVDGIKDQIEVFGWGENTFRYRMDTLDFGEWAAVGRLKRAVRLAKALRVNRLAAAFLLRLKAHTPLMLTARKKG